MIGMVGAIFGVLLGLGCNILLGQVGMDFSSYGGVTDYMALISDKIYPTLGLEHVIQRVVTVIIISTLAAFYPAREASRSEPAKALHFT